MWCRCCICGAGVVYELTCGAGVYELTCGAGVVCVLTCGAGAVYVVQVLYMS